MFACVRLQAKVLVRRSLICDSARSLHSWRTPKDYSGSSVARLGFEWLSFHMREPFLDYFRGVEKYKVFGQRALHMPSNMVNEQGVNKSLLIEVADLMQKEKVARTIDTAKYLFNLDATLGEARFKQGGLFKPKLAYMMFVKHVRETQAKDGSMGKKIQIGPECIVVLDKTNFFAASDGQASDIGTLDFGPSGFQLKVEQVLNIKGYLFHVGKIARKEDVQRGEWMFDDPVECVVDGKARFATSLNHTGLHLLNHAIRNCYGSEDSVIQINSMVQSSGFKCEFKINKALDGGKPTLADVEHIERMCARLIDAALPVNVADQVELNYEAAYKQNSDNKISSVLLNYPLRNLGNVLFPSKMRVVSVGALLDEFQSHQAKYSDLISAEVCCGTHVTNTSQLGQLVITRFEAVGDSSFEIEALTGARAAEFRRNDALLQRNLQQMGAIGGHDASDKLSSPLEHHTRLHRLADLSTKTSEVTKTGDLSYLCVQRGLHETGNIWTSKNQLQHALKRYFELELVTDSSKAINALVIPPSKTRERRELPAVKYLAFDSTLQADQIVSVLKKVERLHPTLLLYNAYRGIYILYSTRAINAHAPTHLFFDTAQAEILASNKHAGLVDKKSFYRVIRCPDAPIHTKSSISNQFKKNLFIP